ncbi:YheT family hydrolase [Acinetobacter soli]|uniref:YheT family hydrolase n=1 Tax=Acinetobacter soli TaxID=487316 RepID=UPI000E5C4024|nr:alpha/beta fold hydrolase [Acinetobacter soli]MDS7693987.1 alpha/beta fold hydrolase [Acinetobacter soli]WOQ37741.1 alpha/beta fold hydrolase [Acinetobacter soli]
MKKINVLKKLTDTLDRLTGADYPQIYLHPESGLHQHMQKLTQLNAKYRPTPWLFNEHLQLLYFDLIKKRFIRQQYDHIDYLKMQDGGETAITWVGSHLPADTPTIVILHTITGSPSSMRELVRDLHRFTGWRIALCVRRGHADLNFSIPQFNLFGSTADLKEQLDFIRLKLPQSDLYAVGSSAGSGLLVRYLGEVADQSCFKAAFAFCPGYNIETGFDKVHPVYSRYMAKKIINRFVKKHLQGWSHIDNLKELLTSKNLTEFHLRYYQLAGFSNYQDYTLATNPMHVFKQIKVPLMVLNSQDDPVCHIDNFAPYLPEIQAMQNIAVVTTKKGSHCAFYEGWRTQSWATKLMADFFLSQK